MKTLKDIGEDALIERIVRLMPRDSVAAAGPGDDCAVIDHSPQSPEVLLLKTDALVRDIHYLAEAPARAVGWKAVARVISDFAAMGGRPEHFLVTLALPPETEVSWVEDLYRGMGNCLETYGGVLAGGETSSVPPGSAAVISIAATGRARREHLVLRSSAKEGDILLVTGLLGGSIHGKHLDFQPRVDAAVWLVRNFKPSAMMDLSDGLAKDLPRMAAASGCGFAVDISRLPATSGCSSQQAAGDGEDFELLFTIAPDLLDGLQATWPFEDLPLTVIGQMTAAGSTSTLGGGWEHFK